MGKFDAMSHQLNERARVNIDKYRKVNHTLRILDENGDPVIGAKVHVNQKNHDFKHGANLFMLDEYKDAEINARYRDTFARYFNLATVPFFWSGTEPEEGKLRYDADSPKTEYRRPPADLCVQYCEEKGILPKIHCLFYDKVIPSWLPKNDHDAMWRLYEKRFAEIAERYTGKMYEIEVTNEMSVTHNGTTCSILANESDIGPRVWQMGRKYFPNEKLMINDAYPKDVGIRRYSNQYYLKIKDYIANGASIDKIGVQSHVFCGLQGPETIEKDLMSRIEHYDPEVVIRGLDILSEFGKPLEITEITIPTLGDGEIGEQLQADILRELYTLYFATPQMESVLYWNVPDNAAVAEAGWDENTGLGGLFHYDMTPKRSALELKRLFTEEWHTEEDLVTDENGCIKFRGFYGDYVAKIGETELEFGLHKSRGAYTTRQIITK